MKELVCCFKSDSDLADEENMICNQNMVMVPLQIKLFSRKLAHLANAGTVSKSTLGPSPLHLIKTLTKIKRSEGKLQKCATFNTILTYAMGVRVEEGQRQKKGLSHKNSYGRITIYLLQRDNLSYLLF